MIFHFLQSSPLQQSRIHEAATSDYRESIRRTLVNRILTLRIATANPTENHRNKKNPREILNKHERAHAHTFASNRISPHCRFLPRENCPSNLEFLKEPRLLRSLIPFGRGVHPRACASEENRITRDARLYNGWPDDPESESLKDEPEKKTVFRRKHPRSFYSARFFFAPNIRARLRGRIGSVSLTYRLYMRLWICIRRSFTPL